MTDREKLVELLENDACPLLYVLSANMEILADYLLANGVRVQRVGHWEKDVDCGCVMHRCSLCGARVVRGQYENENPNLYCYHCGGKMEV